jgi:hypothetical protein
MTMISVDLRGAAEVQKMLGEVRGAKLNNRIRRALRAGVKPFREELRRRASSGRWPRKFRATRTRAHRNPLGVSVSPQSPLSTIFEGGAKTHEIAPKNAKYLANADRGFFAAGAVQHPGMTARPLIGSAFEARRDDAEKAFMDVLMEGL